MVIVTGIEPPFPICNVFVGQRFIAIYNGTSRSLSNKPIEIFFHNKILKGQNLFAHNNEVEEKRLDGTITKKL